MSKPLKVEVTAEDLMIRWNSSDFSTIPLRVLRQKCPCAICQAQNEHNSKRHPIAILTNKEISISDISFTGNYALTIVWQDGHNTGIYEFEYLKKIAQSNKH